MRLEIGKTVQLGDFLKIHHDLLHKPTFLNLIVDLIYRLKMPQNSPFDPLNFIKYSLSIKIHALPISVRGNLASPTENVSSAQKDTTTVIALSSCGKLP